MMVQREDVEKVLHKAEAGQRRAGWDQPPTFWRLVAHGNQLGCVKNPFHADGNPGANLAAMARWMQNHPQGQLAAALAATSGDFVGFAFITETWMNTTMTPEQMLNRTRMLADIPGSVEARNVVAVDTSGRMHFLLRVRGEKLSDRSETPLAQAQVAGRVPAALRDMVLAVARHMPEGSADIGALEKMDVVMNEEQVAADMAARRAQQA